MKLRTLTCVLVLLFLLPVSDFAQNYYVNRKQKLFFGFSGGLNYTGTKVKEHYSLLTNGPTVDEADEKKYEKMFKNAGSQFGLYLSFNFTKQISMIAQPSFHTASFHYYSSFAVSDSINGSDFAMEMKHRQKVSSIIIPIGVRYDFTNFQLSPFVQGGFYASFRTHANKSIFYDFVIDEEVDKEKADQTGRTDLTQHINKSNFGFFAGAGLTYFSKYFAVTLESNFRYGFKSIVNDINRYHDYTGLSMQYLDVLDQLKLFHLDFQLTVMFPMDNSISLDILRKRRH